MRTIRQNSHGKGFLAGQQPHQIDIAQALEVDAVIRWISETMCPRLGDVEMLDASTRLARRREMTRLLSAYDKQK